MKLQLGKIYKVTDGSGLDSGRVGTLVPSIPSKDGFERYLQNTHKWVDLIEVGTENRFRMSRTRLVEVNDAQN